MSHTVAIWGATGNVGKSTLQNLLDNKANIKIVILHRTGSDVSALPAGSNIEKRAIDIDNDANGAIKALKDVDVLVSTVGFPGWPTQFPLIELLAKANPSAVFIPASFGANWSDDDADLPTLKPVVDTIRGFKQKAEILKMAFTQVYAGVFTSFFFGFWYDVSSNALKINDSQRKNAFPLSSVDYIGAGLAQLVSQSPSSIANKSFSLVELFATGQEIVDTFTTVNDSPPAITDYTKADFEGELADLPLGPVSAGYKRHWQEGNFKYPNQVTVEGWTKSQLVDIVRGAKRA